MADDDMKTCGACTAGIVLMQDGIGEQEVVERCDTCGLFETDADAANAVQHLLKLLHTVYEADAELTVADAHDLLAELVEKRFALTKATPATDAIKWKARALIAEQRVERLKQQLEKAEG